MAAGEGQGVKRQGGESRKDATLRDDGLSIHPGKV